MTKQQWLDLEVGDTIIDTLCNGAHRVVKTVKRIKVTRGRPGAIRTTITVVNLRNPKQDTIIFSTSDAPNYGRFQIKPREWKCPTHDGIVFAIGRPRCLVPMADYVCGLELERVR